MDSQNFPDREMSVKLKEQQVPPPHYAPVGMKIFVIAAITPNGSAALLFVIPSQPGFPATQHRTRPRLRLSVRKGA
jgi:hypothetical protein